MTKQRRSVSVEEDVDEYLSREAINASALVNKLVKQHMHGGASKDEIREFRKKQVKSEYEEAVATARRKLEEYNELEDRGESEASVSDEERRDLLQKVRQVPRDTTHPIVTEAAEALGETPENVIAEVYNE